MAQRDIESTMFCGTVGASLSTVSDFNLRFSFPLRGRARSGQVANNVEKTTCNQFEDIEYVVSGRQYWKIKFETHSGRAVSFPSYIC